jgi:hypothetical protein
LLFVWRGYAPPAPQQQSYSLVVSEDPAGANIVQQVDDIRRMWHVLDLGLTPDRTYHWSVAAHGPHGTSTNQLGPQAFVVDAELPNTTDEQLQLFDLGPQRILAQSPLDGDGAPARGVLEASRGVQPAADRFQRQGGAVALSGRDCGLWYRLASWPSQDYSFQAWVCPHELPSDRLQQVFSAWSSGMDDPLRVVLHGRSLHARIEAGRVFGTEGVLVQADQWIHVATVKQSKQLRLYVNGELRHTAEVPERVLSAATDFALGGNPHYRGENECLAGRIDDFTLYARALSAEEILESYEQGRRPAARQ